MYLGGGEERDFVVDKDIFLIGTDASAVDGVLKSRAAGEIQAKITRAEKYLLYRRYEFGKWNTCEW